MTFSHRVFFIFLLPVPSLSFETGPVRHIRSAGSFKRSLLPACHLVFVGIGHPALTVAISVRLSVSFSTPPNQNGLDDHGRQELVFTVCQTCCAHSLVLVQVVSLIIFEIGDSNNQLAEIREVKFLLAVGVLIGCVPVLGVLIKEHRAEIQFQSKWITQVRHTVKSASRPQE